MASGDIIKKIVADESLHGAFIGLLAQEQYAKLSKAEQKKADAEVNDMIEKLMTNDVQYSEQIYSEIGLVHEVKEYLKYNANRALTNMGREAKYQVGEVNQIVLNGLNVETTQHDFFSKKSTNYEKALKVEQLKDDDFAIDDDDLDIWYNSVMKIVLIRHGESEWNKLNLFTGWTDIGLSERGVLEAKQAGQ